jgi:putative DNA primase/helicase
VSLEREKVRAVLDDGFVYPRSKPNGEANGEQAAPEENEAPEPRAMLDCAANISAQPIEWLWQHWLVAGKLNLLAGAPGTGKTTLALALAAIVTTGGVWPDSSRCERAGHVLMWSSEDDPADTLVPRLYAMGADLQRVHFVRGVADSDGRILPFDPARDMSLLSERITGLGGARLLIVDPLLSAVSGDAHRANDVRRNLQPVVDLAAAHECAVLGISHFSKGSKGATPAERVIGSQAFVALARMVLLAAKDENSDRRIFMRGKSNIAPDDGGYSYSIEQVDAQPGITASKVIWGESIQGNARDMLDEIEREDDDEERSELDDARDFLCSLLEKGAVPVKSIEADAKGAGYSWRTIERAKRVLGVESRKDPGSKGQWKWALPGQGDATSEEPL